MRGNLYNIVGYAIEMCLHVYRNNVREFLNVSMLLNVNEIQYEVTIMNTYLVHLGSGLNYAKSGSGALR